MGDVSKFAGRLGAAPVGMCRAGLPGGWLGRWVCGRRRFAGESTGETAAVALVRGIRVMVAGQVSPPSVMSVSWIGREFPLHTSSPGKLVLASLDPGHLDRFLVQPLQVLAERTITDPGKLRQELARVRASGVAASDQEFERGCVGFSAVVADWAGRPAAILSITGPSFRMPRNRFAFYRQQLLRSVHAAAATLGYAGQPSPPAATGPRPRAERNHRNMRLRDGGPARAARRC